MLNALVNKVLFSVVVQTLSYCPIVGGIPKGNGTGKSKQLAKEEAARQALNALGWATGA
jgi:dsRNA-specific ribonuclease